MLLQGLIVDVRVYGQTLFQLSYNLHHRVKDDDTGGAVFGSCDSVSVDWTACAFTCVWEGRQLLHL